jgi:hypothetical protein
MKMFESREGKQLRKGMLVGLHFNAKRKDYSIVEMKSLRTAGKVLGYVKKGKVSNGYQVVGKAGQKDVRESNQKNRHAFLVGTWEGFDLENSIDGKIYYNPHILENFVDYDLFIKEGEVKEIDEKKFIQFDLLEENGNIKPLVSYIN